MGRESIESADAPPQPPPRPPARPSSANSRRSWQPDMDPAESLPKNTRNVSLLADQHAFIGQTFTTAASIRQNVTENNATTASKETTNIKRSTTATQKDTHARISHAHQQIVKRRAGREKNRATPTNKETNAGGLQLHQAEKLNLEVKPASLIEVVSRRGAQHKKTDPNFSRKQRRGHVKADRVVTMASEGRSTVPRPGAYRMKGIDGRNQNADGEDSSGDSIYYSTAQEEAALQTGHTDLLGDDENNFCVQRKKQLLALISCSLVIMIVTVGVAVGTGFSKAGAGGNIPVVANSIIPTATPTACTYQFEVPMPDIFAACACFQSFDEIPMESTLRHNVLAFITEIYKPINASPTLSGCHPNNMAMHWLMDDIVSTNNSDTTSWKSRYILACLFVVWSKQVTNVWSNATGWLSPAPECTWTGVECLEGTRSISVLNLADKGLSPSIPVELFLLSDLGKLDLESNNIRGTIPRSLFMLTNLRLLQLNGNAFNGTLSQLIGSLTKLESLSARFNKFAGTLPSEIQKLSLLQILDIRSNALSGPIPTQLGLLNALRFLALDENNFIGTLPTEIGLLSDLRDLRASRVLSINSLNGTLPTELGQLTKLQLLTVADHDLTGSIPSEIGNLSLLREIDLSNTRLRGTLPTEIGRLSNLSILILHDVREVRGTLPSELSGFSLPRCIHFGGTRLEGRIPDKWCTTAKHIVIPCPSLLDCPSRCCECSTRFRVCTV